MRFAEYVWRDIDYDYGQRLPWLRTGKGKIPPSGKSSKPAPRTASHPPAAVKMFLGDKRGDGLTGTD